MRLYTIGRDGRAWQEALKEVLSELFQTILEPYELLVVEVPQDRFGSAMKALACASGYWTFLRANAGWGSNPPCPQVRAV
ncbi:hypothetical protein YIM73052_03540 [Thermus antranikianii]